VHGASTDTGQDHLIALNVADPDGSFDTTEQTANLVIDPFDQGVQIKTEFIFWMVSSSSRSERICSWSEVKIL